MPRRPRFAASIALSAVFAAGYAISQRPSVVAPPAVVRTGFDAITIESAQKNLGYLAGPECEGRGTGQPGFRKAAEYMAARFKELGLVPAPGMTDYFQKAPFFRASLVSARIESDRGGFGEGDLFMNSPNADVNLTAGTVIVPIEGDARLEDVSGYAGKIVIVPNTAPSRRALSRLQGSNAAAVLLVQDTVPKNHAFGRETKPTAGRVPIFRVRKEAIVSALGLTADRLMTSTTGRPLKISARVKIEEITVENVVAMLPGTDGSLAAETVGIGAHLDHLGRNGDTISYGADDDGSGSAALIETATAFVRNPTKPKRSILFMAFFGEEMGLLGSKFLVENPPVDLTKMIAEFQMDMVGRDSDGAQNGDPKRVDKASENVDTIRLVGSKRISTELDRIILAQNAYVGFRFKYDAEDVYERSDHYMFAQKGIPIAFLFDGFHPDYHRPTDTVEKINFVKLTNAAKLTYLSAMAVANRAEPLPKDVTPK